MCLIVFAWQVVPGAPLVAASNRDEYYDRAAIPAHWWSEHPDVYAGRDLQGGGTWMGITRNGRFAAVTNIRSPLEKRLDAPSRGVLVADYLKGQASAAEYVADLSVRAHEFNGFNLVVGDSTQLIWYSNAQIDDERNGKPLAPGIYGLSNASLDAPWPKVVRTKAQFASLLCQGAPEDAYFEMLTDTTRASDCRLPKTGVSIEWERILSAVCIESPEYGTRASTVAQLYADNTAALHERAIR
ncbi:NRDE family protein [Noviherbaspirillum cavernae]|uniref:NRDE family protein n=1 Tax=Noviherbaspirillum cavernae TaxID=2320862 RepID=A0A418X138_9BURK|nr:NRDE family protein [Noviherbaspirillum cavernae]RJG06155.1 NRDE family protein [Noviherbaspirillum cavernae]